MFEVTDIWRATYPGASIGILAMRNVANPETHAALDARKAELESQIRASFAGREPSAIKELEIIQAYSAYYKRFKKTYHVQLQLESVAFKGKSIPRVAALVEAMFMSELKNLLLTAGHDVSALDLPIRIDVATGSEVFTRINGEKQTLKPGEMFIADRQGVISSVIYGPDHRTQIVPSTNHVLFCVYAPKGIAVEMVKEHLEDIRANVTLVAPGSETEMLNVYSS
jgi:DNA/RNA-binding domain of Phe-tRNA-synthetase-like protein